MKDTTPVKVHRVELYIVDHDDIGADEIREVLENTRYPNRCITPEVGNIETKTIEFHDEHPINLISQSLAACHKLFMRKQ